MSKQDKEGKIQFVFVNVEGDQETLQEALRQVGGVLNRGMNPPQPRTLITVPVPKNLGEGSQNGSENGSQNGESTQQVYEVKFDDGEENPAEGSNTSSPAGDKPKRERKVPRTPAILKDFDPSDAEMSLEDYAKQKNTSTLVNKYLVVAAWFKKYKEVSEIDTSHIYTCFQLMKWDAPNDMGQAFRNIKTRYNYFDNGSKQNFWQINIVGLNEVDRMKSSNSSEE